MAWPPILVRYGEIGIKSRQVRSQFEKRLVERIEEQLVRRGVESEVQREHGRMFVRAADVEKALDALRHTFGVVSASPAVEAEPTPDGVAEVVLRIAREAMPAGASFAVRVKRSGTHAFSSLDVAKRCAERILTELADKKPTVDLTRPDFEVSSEVRDGEAFVFTRTVRGPGGLPLGSQGRVGVYVDDARAAHAAWLMGKRGSALIFFSNDTSAAEKRLAPLLPWVSHVRLHQVDPEDVEAFRALLLKHRCQALVTSGGAEAALASFARDHTLGLPVFRPLVGYEGERFRELCRVAELPQA